MPLVLISLGVVIALAGIGSIAAGAPSWVLGLGLGSALIQSGAVGLVGGFLLVGIGFVLRSLRDLSRRIDGITAAPAPSSAAPRPLPTAPPPRAPAKRDPRDLREPPRREPPAFPGRGEGRPEIGGRPELRAETREHSPLERDDLEDFPEPPFGDRRPPRRAPEPELRPAAPPRNRPRPAAPVPPVERAPAYEDEFGEPLAPVGNEGMSTTVVRSGIIGGMAYTLYTDGSIEAELPIGTVRFASIEELQEHVSQTGEDADIDFGGPHAPKN